MGRPWGAKASGERQGSARIFTQGHTRELKGSEGKQVRGLTADR